MSAKRMEQISIRLDTSLRARARRLLAALSVREEFRGMPLTRASVLRTAMLEGLTVLERRYLESEWKR